MHARNSVFTIGAACSAFLSAAVFPAGASAEASALVRAAPAGAPRAEAEARSLRAVERLRKTLKIEGLSIAVVDSKGPIWTAGAGLAEPGRPFGPEALSFPGSVSKLFTASAVMLLAERGLVDLDAPLSRYLPEFSVRTDSWSADAITVRSLLTHSSGLPSDIFRGMVEEDFPSGAFPPAPSASELPALLAREYAARPPFAAFAYSNLGYSLLGSLVERVSGSSLRDFMEGEIFGPLGMSSSVFAFGEKESRLASPGYAKGGARPPPRLRDEGAGGLLTTAGDMGRFLSSILASARGGKGLLKAESVGEMWRRQNGRQKADLDFSVGLGWWLGPVDSLPGETVVVHGGDWMPFCSLALVLPERDLAIFVMANSLEGDSSMSLEPLALELLRAFASSERGVELGRAAPAGPSLPVPDSLRARLTGDWASLAGIIRIRERGGRLKIGFAGKTFDAALRTDGRVEMQLRFLGLKLPLAALEEFQLSAEEAEGRPILGFRSHGILLSACERIGPLEPGPEWRARLGSYRMLDWPEGLVRDVEIGLSPEGYLMLRYKFFGGSRPREYPLAVLDGKRALLMGSGRNLGESVLAESREGREIIRWSGFSLERK